MLPPLQVRALLLGSALFLGACEYYTCDGQACGTPCTYCRRDLRCDPSWDDCHTETECWQLAASDSHRCDRSQNCREVDLVALPAAPLCQ